MLKTVILPPTCAAPTEIASRTEALEAAKFRLALSIDLAAIISLALVFLAQDLVGRIEFGKALSCFGVILVGVRVKLLGELTKCALDRGRIRILLHPQHFIGVAHRKYLRLGAGVQPRLFGSNVVVMRQLRNAKRLGAARNAPAAGEYRALSMVAIARNQLVRDDRNCPDWPPGSNDWAGHPPSAAGRPPSSSGDLAPTLQGNYLDAFVVARATGICSRVGVAGDRRRQAAARYRRHGLRLRTSQRPTSLRQASPCIHASALSWT